MTARVRELARGSIAAGASVHVSQYQLILGDEVGAVDILISAPETTFRLTPQEAANEYTFLSVWRSAVDGAFNIQYADKPRGDMVIAYSRDIQGRKRLFTMSYNMTDGWGMGRPLSIFEVGENGLSKVFGALLPDEDQCRFIERRSAIRPTSSPEN